MRGYRAGIQYRVEVVTARGPMLGCKELTRGDAREKARALARHLDPGQVVEVVRVRKGEREGVVVDRYGFVEGEGVVRVER